jgi:hypothetical protein
MGQVVRMVLAVRQVLVVQAEVVEQMETQKVRFIILTNLKAQM